MSKIEMSYVVKIFQYRCTETNFGCEHQRFTHEDYIQHLKDHANGKIPYHCPSKCGHKMPLDKVFNHFVKLNGQDIFDQDLVGMIGGGEICKMQNL